MCRVDRNGFRRTQVGWRSSCFVLGPRCFALVSAGEKSIAYTFLAVGYMFNLIEKVVLVSTAAKRWMYKTST